MNEGDVDAPPGSTANAALGAWPKVCVCRFAMNLYFPSEATSVATLVTGVPGIVIVTEI